MTRLAWTFLRSAGWSRAALLAGTTAVATALLLVALTMLLLDEPTNHLDTSISIDRCLGVFGARVRPVVPASRAARGQPADRRKLHARQVMSGRLPP